MARSRNGARIVGGSGRLRLAVYWLATVGSRGTKTHALIEGEERTVCGCVVDYELSEELIAGCGDEPNCRRSRAEIRRRAQALDPDALRRPRPERMLCPRCLRANLKLTVREVSVDRCVVLREEGEFVYDVDGDPKTRDEERTIECLHCGAQLAEADLVSFRDRRPPEEPFDHEAFRVKRAAAGKAIDAKLAATVERLSQPPPAEEPPF
jgi:hypothetical protein